MFRPIHETGVRSACAPSMQQGVPKYDFSGQEVPENILTGNDVYPYDLS